MTRGQLKNINNIQGNIAQPESSCRTTASPGYSNTAEAQENDLKLNFLKAREALKEEMNKSFKEIKEKKQK